jgi:hypothetical protein
VSNDRSVPNQPEAGVKWLAPRRFLFGSEFRRQYPAARAFLAKQERRES